MVDNIRNQSNNSMRSEIIASLSNSKVGDCGYTLDEVVEIFADGGCSIREFSTIRLHSEFTDKINNLPKPEMVQQLTRIMTRLGLQVFPEDVGCRTMEEVRDNIGTVLINEKGCSVAHARAITKNINFN